MPRFDGGKTKGQDSSRDIRLIELVRDNPELYDSGHPLYKDNNHKRITWEYVSDEMNTPVDKVKKLWRKLRCDYTKRCRDVEAEKTGKTTPCDEALAFLMTSVIEYADENSRGNISLAISPRAGGEDRQASQLTAISEEERSTATLVPQESVDPGVVPGPPAPLSAVSSQEDFRPAKTSDRVLRPRHSEPAILASRESIKPQRFDGAGGPRRLTATPTTPGTRSRNRKLILDPNDSTRIFFESMAITVASFPQHLQALVKLQICKIVSETECDLSLPKIP